MPRVSPFRSLANERNVARRIQFEREQRNWTYEGTAKRMGDAGCPIQPTAVYKIEKADPPRRITVDELVAFAKVFDTSVENLLAPAELANRPQWQALAKKALDVFEVLPAAVRSLSAVVAEGRDLSETDPAAYDYFRREVASSAATMSQQPDNLEVNVAKKLTELVNTIIAVHGQPGAHPGKMPVRRRRAPSSKQHDKVRA
jgi:transcriptional regulator with XRE-family HTH domain